jgi:hypothetical protein
MKHLFWFAMLGAVVTDAIMLIAIRFGGYEPVWMPMAKQILGCQ